MENFYGRLLLLGLSACAVQCFTGHPWWPHDAGRGARGARGVRSAWGGLTPQQRRTPGGASIVGITFPILPWNASKNWNGTNMGIETNPKKN